LDLDRQRLAGDYCLGDSPLDVYSSECLGRKTPVQQQRSAQHPSDDQQQVRFEKDAQPQREHQQKQVLISFTTNRRSAVD